jgi:uncharacterized OB-fold protein
MEAQAADKKREKPVPRPSPETIPFWEAARAHRLLLPLCNHCGRFWFPPTQRCAHCLSADFVWRQARGTGHIYSFVVYHRVYHPGFEGAVPYVVAIVELDEGPRLITNIVGMSPDEVRCDMRVEVVFDESESGVAIPKFSPLS